VGGTGNIGRGGGGGGGGLHIMAYTGRPRPNRGAFFWLQYVKGVLFRYNISRRGTFSPKMVRKKGKGLELRAEPPRIKLC